LTKEELAIRQAIRDMKEQIKALALQQKEERREFRKKMSEWDKTPYGQRANMTYPGYFSGYSHTLSAWLIIYGQLRNRPHMTKEATEKYFNGVTYTEIRHREDYKNKRQEFVKAHPETASLISEEIWK
jgi:hypothetical protein